MGGSCITPIFLTHEWGSEESFGRPRNYTRAGVCMYISPWADHPPRNFLHPHHSGQFSANIKLQPRTFLILVPTTCLRSSMFFCSWPVSKKVSYLVIVFFALGLSLSVLNSFFSQKQNNVVKGERLMLFSSSFILSWPVKVKLETSELWLLFVTYIVGRTLY